MTYRFQSIQCDPIPLVVGISPLTAEVFERPAIGHTPHTQGRTGGKSPSREKAKATLRRMGGQPSKRSGNNQRPPTDNE